MSTNSPASRREFLITSAAAAAALAAPSGVHAAGGDTLKVGLIGCGGRGTGAASNTLAADKNIKLIAMADAFEDRLKDSLERILKDPAAAPQVDVKPDHQFVGFDGYKKVIDLCDVVLLCTPPHFRPLHLKAAIDAGKHVFAEKPVAVDAPGVRSVLETCKLAEKKGLSVVSGLCLRYDNSFREAVQRIHGGQIGEVQVLMANDYRGSIWVKPRQSVWNDMTYHMRNWYYFTWLSGDFNVEQHVHFLDACSWVMKNEYPVRAVGMGGRTVRHGEDYGNIYDHFSVVYEYENGAKLFSNCRQQKNCYGDMSGHVIGTRGTAQLSEKKGGMFIKGDKPWIFEGPANEMFVHEHEVLYNAIRTGKPVNNGDYMARSTLLAILGRMAAYTGQRVTWEQALNSKEDLTPPAYEWGPLPERLSKISIPGVTKLI